ncbi:MAG: hypothetical protein ACI396_07615 [Acutalibacteraceae bacterium]
MNDLFGDFFDFNGDGDTDFFEEVVGMNIIKDIEREDDSDFDDDFDDFDDDMYDDDDFDDNDTFSGTYSTPSTPSTPVAKPVTKPIATPTHVSNTPPPQNTTDSYGYDDERYTDVNDDKSESKQASQDYVPEVWSRSYYISRRQTETQGLFKSIVLLLLMMLAPFILGLFAYACYDGENGFGTFLCVIFTLGAIISGLWVLYHLAKSVYEYVSNVRRLAYNFTLRGKDSDVKHFKKMRIVKRIVAIFITVGIIAAIAVPLTMNYVNKESAYRNAENLVWNEYYSNAIHKLEALEDENYKDTQALIAYCQSNIKYARGDYKNAYFDLYGVQFKYQNAQNSEKIRRYREKLNDGYNSYIENSIYSYTAAPTKARTTKYEPTTKRSYNYKSYTKSRTTYADPYDAKDYVDAEDFYYDHYDDFFDYEEAEDYYNEYGE